MLLIRRLVGSLCEQLAGLLHDVLCTPFSHLIDYVLNMGGEDYQVLIILFGYRNSLNLSQLCSRKPPLAGGRAKFDRMSKQQPQPFASGMPDTSSRARTERPAGRLPQRLRFTPWGKLWQQCFATATPPSDFRKGAGFSPTGSKPAPFAFYGRAASVGLLAALIHQASSLFI
jgi:hypothetical protein